MKNEKSETKPFLSTKNNCYKSFYNLREEKEKSFQINSSYDNINKISSNKYIKDINLQNKTKDFIVKVASNLNIKSPKEKNAFLGLTNSFNFINDIDSNENKSNIVLSDNDLEINKSIQIKRLLTRKSDDNNIYLLKGNKIKNSLSVNDEKKKLLSTRTIINAKNLKLTNINATPKSKKRQLNKKNLNVNKKLNTISKNIKKANESINNPNEFYMNFFNNIIKKSGLEDDEKKSKKDKKNSKSGSNFNYMQISARDNKKGKYILNNTLGDEYNNREIL
jgi:hypothetical protein